MGTRVYIDKNLKKFTTNKLNAVTVDLLTDVTLPLTTESSVYNNTITDDGSYLYKTPEGKYSTDAVTIEQSSDSYSSSNIINKLGSYDLDETIYVADETENTHVSEKSNFYSQVVVDSDNYTSFSVDAVLSGDVENLLEDSAFDSAVMYLIDSITGGTYKYYCSYSVALASGESVIFNIEDVNVETAIKLFNVSTNLDIYINTYKIDTSELEIDSNGGIIYPVESTDMNIKLVNNSGSKILVTNPFFLYE